MEVRRPNVGVAMWRYGNWEARCRCGDAEAWKYAALDVRWKAFNFVNLSQPQTASALSSLYVR